MSKKIDPILASAGVDQTEAQEVDNALKGDDIQAKIAEFKKDKNFTDEEKDEIGEMVFDEANKALAEQGKEGLSEDEQMAVAEYCAKCLDKDANAAADQAVAETSAE